jgi:hypothetical protein
MDQMVQRIRLSTGDSHRRVATDQVSLCPANARHTTQQQKRPQGMHGFGWQVSSAQPKRQTCGGPHWPLALQNWTELLDAHCEELGTQTPQTLPLAQMGVLPVQSAHAAPLLPQVFWAVPPLHVPLLQQPPLHGFVDEQLTLHSCVAGSHASPTAQSLAV